MSWKRYVLVLKLPATDAAQTQKDNHPAEGKQNLGHGS
jgi:hypothetical protein